MASIKDLKRMCSAYTKCEKCPMSMYLCAPGDLPDNADEIVNKWVAEHPIKTYAMDFFEKFPDAPRNSGGVPKICRSSAYGEMECCTPRNCTNCWNQEMEE